MKKNIGNGWCAEAAFLVLLLAVFLCGCTRKTEEIADPEELLFEEPEVFLEEETTKPEDAADCSAESAAAETEQMQTYYVHVCGAVKAPGVYPLMAGERVFEALAAAGGFTEDACADYVNQAAAVFDGMRLWIPSVKEAEEMGWQHPGSAGYGADFSAQGTDGQKMSQNASGAGSKSTLVNINTASEELLCTLSGIGQSKAQAVIAYREEHGDFLKKEDIMKVAGIKQSGYEKIKDHICVEWE